MSDDISQVILDELREHRRESNERHKAIDTRLGLVERWQSNAEGKATMLGILVTAVAGFVAWIVGIVHNH